MFLVGAFGADSGEVVMSTQLARILAVIGQLLSVGLILVFVVSCAISD
jgi:hypothetical protein